MNKVKGLIAATFAAYNVDGTIDLEAIPPYVEYLIGQGVSGVFVCGTNGEGPNLTVEERMEITEKYIASVAGRIRVFVHVGHSSITEAKRLAVHAQEHRADYISSVSAFYFKPTSVANLVDCMAEIAAAAPKLPFFYYHIPALTGIQIDMLAFLELAEEKIPNLAGIKYTAATIHEYQACLHYKSGKFDILFGYDELLLPALAVGAKGAIGSTYNYGAKLYAKVMDYFEEGKLDEAEKLHFHAVQMIQLLVKYGPIPTQRAIMKKIGLNLGIPRLPLAALSEDQEKNLYTDLANSDFLSHVASS
ncbi:N-acetylneuraminate lyase [Sphingobacterium alkalisoli]|uniref:N-acetylneuraminate lyase n=1 Tax=Sphingobacterium alkalisoli TaxID=1874115 RepID=A0A4U0H3N1_9SPHI|nr:dihydrodipicolinate synthase family protein [Sphingobacterium alkalisoli]TJY65754.1 N-acetylneuraminate lyase [Sphingobacterium alkalisoli]GGH18530.1 N-acetylneuraminate lyase [Sphingobacterium alkalisoli]